ncbi:MAG: pyruvate formate lyase family protein [bacterium]|nr:pyruvate formate lyase family protein [bacterium]
MSKVTVDDVSLKDITLEGLPRLKRLREIHFNTQPEVCVELPRLMTRYMQQMDNPSDSSELRAGKRLKYVLENKSPIIHEDDLLAGTTTTKIKGVPIYPQFFAQSLWPELETLSSRKKNPYTISQEAIDALNLEIFPYWMDRTVMEVCRKDYDNPFCQRIMERLVFFLATKAHCISHTVADYEAVVKEGMTSIIKRAQEKEASETDPGKRDFYKAAKMGLEGVITYAHKLSQEATSLAEKETDPVRKKELAEMSSICQRVPKERSNTFSKGLQAIWTCHVALHQENNNISLSLGRLDQVLYPLYRQGIEEGTLTPARAVELIGCLFLKLADHVPMSPETAEELFGGSGSNQAVTLGGIDPAGKDAVNDLTYIILRATELLQVRDPNVNARYYPGVNPKEYLNRLCEVNINTKATPCFHNDIEVIKTLLVQDYSLEDARDYSIIGCVEPQRGSKTFGYPGAIALNLASVLEMSLFQGRHRLTGEEQFGPKTPPPSRISSLDEFLSAFKEQLIFLIDQGVELNNMLGKTHLKVHPLPLLSSLTQNTLEKGKDVLEGGAVYNTSGVFVIGLAEVVDSLCAIEEFVFDKKEITFSELIAAIEKDWAGHEKLRLKIIHSGNKFGTASKDAKDMTGYLMDFLHAEYQKRENFKGGRYVVGYWTMTTHAGWGLLTGAMPSGRKNRDVLPSGITPVSGQAPELTEALRFVAGLDSTKMANSHALNLKYTPARDPSRMMAKFAAGIEAYMKMGGLQVQFNLIDRATLEEARDHPEKHPNLLVRVSGYTAYFADLNPHMQKEIITRAEYDLQTGKEVR